MNEHEQTWVDESVCLLFANFSVKNDEFLKHFFVAKMVFGRFYEGMSVLCVD